MIEASHFSELRCGNWPLCGGRVPGIIRLESMEDGLMMDKLGRYGVWAFVDCAPGGRVAGGLETLVRNWSRLGLALRL